MINMLVYIVYIFTNEKKKKKNNEKEKHVPFLPFSSFMRCNIIVGHAPTNRINVLSQFRSVKHRNDEEKNNEKREKNKR